MACPTLGTSCATLLQIISIGDTTVLETFGGPSQGTITFNALTVPGDTVTIGDITWTAVVGIPGPNQWSTDGAITDQLNSLVSSINADPVAIIYFTAVKIFGKDEIKITTVTTGINSAYPWSTTGGNISLSPENKLEGGDCDLQFYSDVACNQISSACWGNLKTPAHIYLTLHLIETSLGQDSGQKTSIKIDKIQKNYSYLSPTDPMYGNTKWGRLYSQLWSRVVKMPFVANGPRYWPPGYYGRWGRCW